MNSINYIVLNPYHDRLINVSDFEHIYKLYYILDNSPFYIIIGIYKSDLVISEEKCLTLDQIIEEQSILNGNADFVRYEKIL